MLEECPSHSSKVRTNNDHMLWIFCHDNTDKLRILHALHKGNVPLNKSCQLLCKFIICFQTLNNHMKNV